MTGRSNGILSIIAVVDHWDQKLVYSPLVYLLKTISNRETGACSLTLRSNHLGTRDNGFPAICSTICSQPADLPPRHEIDAVSTSRPRRTHREAKTCLSVLLPTYHENENNKPKEDKVGYSSAMYARELEVLLFHDVESRRSSTTQVFAWATKYRASRLCCNTYLRAKYYQDDETCAIVRIISAEAPGASSVHRTALEC